MCGIIAAFSTTLKKNKKIEVKAFSVNDMIMNQYEDQNSRGQRGFGIIRIDRKGKVELDRSCEPVKFLLDLYMKPSEMIIAHHRTPTSTDNKITQTHPMYVSNKMLKHDYYVMHNGILSNDTELHEKHKELGFEYTTEYIEDTGYVNSYKRTKFNDSEALAIELALFAEDKIECIGCENQAAFVYLQVNKKTKIAEKVFFGRNGFSSDLNMMKEKGKMLISSEGEGDEVPVNILWSFNVNDPTMELSSQKIEFKKAFKAPVVPEVTNKIIHAAACVCVDCSTPAGFHQAHTQTLLPITQEINAVKKTEDVKVETVLPRAWVDMDDETIEEAEYENVVFADKNYKETTCEEFKGKIKDEDSRGVTHIIDDSLDEELEKITDIMESFKKMLNAHKVDASIEGFFIAQIAKITKTMTAMADIAEEEYTQKKLLEEDEEAAAMKDAAQANFDWNSHLHGAHGKRYSAQPGDPRYNEVYDD